MAADLKRVEQLRKQFAAELQAAQATPAELLKDNRLKQLFAAISSKSPSERQAFGRAVNSLKDFLLAQQAASGQGRSVSSARRLDVTAPCDVNQVWEATLFSPEEGSLHPILQTQDKLVDIFVKMGFSAVGSKQLDNDFYMFDSLNFPENHPARDEFDTFYVDGRDKHGRPLVAPAHTSVMQNRALRCLSPDLSDWLEEHYNQYLNRSALSKYFKYHPPLELNYSPDLSRSRSDLIALTSKSDRPN